MNILAKKTAELPGVITSVSSDLLAVPNKSRPTNFDFGGAIKPDYVVKCSYGNDSIALLQYLHEYEERFGKMGKIVVLYNNTGWAASWWDERVQNAEENITKKYGWIPCRTKSKGMVKMIKLHHTWPDPLRRFCTEELKIIPTQSWLSEHDPEATATTVCGVRREESDARALWPEWASAVEASEGRQQWSPLVYHTAKQRDELIIRAGWKPLPHRSRECRCVLANSQDIKSWSEDDIKDIEEAEAMMKSAERRSGKTNYYMFHPHGKKGNPLGIRAVVEWAKQVKPKQAKLEPPSGCDSGYCTG